MKCLLTRDRAAMAGLAMAAIFVTALPVWGQSADKPAADKPAENQQTDSKQTSEIPPDKPYTVKDGKVDPKTYNGFRRYHSICHTCHGPDGMGSSFAPSLVDSLKRLSADEFAGIVAGGREGNNGGNVRVMPAFASDPNVMEYLDDIYAYLKARSDGALGRGRPERLTAAATN